MEARSDTCTLEQHQGFAPLCPDFVLELACETDDRADLHANMQEYLDEKAHKLQLCVSI